jgi:hypothetical protein
MTPTDGGSGITREPGGFSVEDGRFNVSPSEVQEMQEKITHEWLMSRPAFKDAALQRSLKKAKVDLENDLIYGNNPMIRDHNKRIVYDQGLANTGDAYISPRGEVWIRGPRTWQLAGYHEQNDDHELIVRDDGRTNQYKWVPGAGWMINSDYDDRFKIREFAGFTDYLSTENKPRGNVDYSYSQWLPTLDEAWGSIETKDQTVSDYRKPQRRVKLESTVTQRFIIDVPQFDEHDDEKREAMEREYVAQKLIELRSRVYKYNSNFAASGYEPESLEAITEISFYQSDMYGGQKLNYWQDEN